MSNFNQEYIQTTCFGGGQDLPNRICPCTEPLCGDESNDGMSNCSDVEGICSIHAYHTSLGTNGNSPGCPSGMYQCTGYDWPSSLASAWLCSSADPGQCPSIDNGNTSIIANNASLTSVGCSNTTSTTVNINCTYNAQDFNTVQSANNWQTTNWGSFSDQATKNLNDNIYPSVCGKTASSVGLSQYCPIDSITGQQMSDCSRIVLNNDPDGYGQTCTTWCINNPQQCTTTMTNYCRINDTPDCQCVNRTNDQVYRALVGNSALASLPAKCWWVPCSGSQAAPYLIPNDQLDASCPSSLNVCQSVIQAIDNVDSSINVSNNPSVIDCGQNNGGGGGGEVSSNNTVIIIVIIVVVIIILIIIGVIIYLLARKKK